MALVAVANHDLLADGGELSVEVLSLEFAVAGATQLPLMDLVEARDFVLHDDPHKPLKGVTGDCLLSLPAVTKHQPQMIPLEPGQGALDVAFRIVEIRLEDSVLGAVLHRNRIHAGF